MEIKERGPCRKLYEIQAENATIAKSAASGDNTLSGNASAMGILDRGADVMFPGAYAGTLRGFLKDGFVAVGHSWGSLPVAMPTKAYEQGQYLYVEALFHSHPEAQAARTVCIERLQNRKSVGLSVGFLPDYEKGVVYIEAATKDYRTGARVVYFENGETLLAFAKAKGFDMRLFDTKGIGAWKAVCRGILGVQELYEFSIVTVPMQPHATATDAKAHDALSTAAPIWVPAPATLRSMTPEESALLAMCQDTLAQSEVTLRSLAQDQPRRPMGAADEALLKKLQAACIRFSPMGSNETRH